MNQEKLLRESIKKAVSIYFQKNNESVIKKLIDEDKLRKHVRVMLLEAATEDPSADVHENTGINTLKDLLKNTNILQTLRESYKTLTTNDEQRKSFRAHIISWIKATLIPIKLNDEAPLQEAIEVDIIPTAADQEKFIEAEDGSPALPDDETPQPDEDFESIPGEDTTGRNKAERVYKKIESSIIDYYAILDNEEDQEMYFDYLIANIKLYFDKWENEIAISPEEPSNEEYESAATPPEAEVAPAGVSPPEAVPPAETAPPPI